MILCRVLLLFMLCFSGFLSAKSGEDFIPHYQKADGMLNSGHDAEAIEYLASQIRANDLSDLDKYAIAIKAVAVMKHYGKKKETLSVIKPFYQSLEKKYGSKSAITFECRTLLIDAYSLSGDVEKAIYYANMQIKSAGRPVQLFEAYNALAGVYLENKEYKKALDLYSKSERYYSYRKNGEKSKKELDSIYYNMGVSYRHLHDYPNALKYFQLALKRARKANTGGDNALLGMASSYRDMGEYQKARQSLKELADYTLKTKGQNNYHYIMTENEIGVFESDLGHYSQALSHYQKVLEYGNRLDKKEFIALATKNMGYAYFSEGNTRLAETYLKKSLAIYQQLPPGDSLASNYEYLASLAEKKHSAQKEVDYYYDKALAVYKDSNGQHTLAYAKILTNRAMTYQKRQKYTEANELYEQSMHILKEQDPNGQPMVLLLSNWATLCIEQKNYAKAESFLQKAIEISKQSYNKNHPTVAYAYNNLGYLYGMTHQKKKALDSYKKAVDIAKLSLGMDNKETRLYQRNYIKAKIENFSFRRRSVI